MPIKESQFNYAKTVTYAIIGSGFGGLAMAIRLIQQQQYDFVILEKAADFGGTWRENQYPGAACDVQSHLYSFSFEPKHDWSKRYAGSEEIQQYILNTAHKYKLQDFCLFEHEVTAMQYDEAVCQWTLSIKNKSDIQAQYVVLASGPLHVPQIPHIKGIENFKGKAFHSAQWDHNYDLTGKHVASIGTGGSAIQYLPEIAPKVKQLYAFQRTAAWVIPRDERKYLNINKRLFEKLPALRQLHRMRLYWSNEARVVPIFRPDLMRAAQKLAALFIRLQVKDKKTAAQLTPDYIMGCKRILISNKYYPTFNRKNVQLITDGIREITEDAIITKNGERHPIDCLIYGTGFITDPRTYMKDFPCIGRDGHDLMQDWKDGAESYYGITTKGFPNLFQLVGPNTGLGHNSIIFMIEAQVEYILKLVALAEKQQANAIEVKSSVQDQFNTRMQNDLKGTVWQSGCNSWYQQDNGKNFTLWPGYTWKYWLETQKVNASDYIFSKAKTSAAANR